MGLIGFQEHVDDKEKSDAVISFSFLFVSQIVYLFFVIFNIVLGNFHSMVHIVTNVVVSKDEDQKHYSRKYWCRKKGRRVNYYNLYIHELIISIFSVDIQCPLNWKYYTK